MLSQRSQPASENTDACTNGQSCEFVGADTLKTDRRILKIRKKETIYWGMCAHLWLCAALQTHAQMDMRLEDEGIFEKPGQGPPLGPNDPRRLAVRAGCWVTPELMSMFEMVSGGKRCELP